MKPFSLKCPVCQETAITKLGEDVQLTGKMGDKVFQSAPTRVFRCNTCGFLMFFDQGAKLAELTRQDPDQ